MLNETDERQTGTEAASPNQQPVVMCDCGNNPRIVFVRNSFLRLRVVGCDKCFISGPARRTNEDAWEQWNLGHRINSDGVRVCKCCT